MTDILASRWVANASLYTFQVPVLFPEAVLPAEGAQAFNCIHRRLFRDSERVDSMRWWWRRLELPVRVARLTIPKERPWEQAPVADLTRDPSLKFLLVMCSTLVCDSLDVDMVGYSGKGEYRIPYVNFCSDGGRVGIALLYVKISDFRFHDLRHTAARWMRMKGADIHTVALILGHKDLRMAARYQHLSPAFLSDAVKLLDGAYAEKPQNANGETPERPENESNSDSIVTTALPAPKLKEAA